MSKVPPALSCLPEGKVQLLKSINLGAVIQVIPTQQINAIVYNELSVTQIVQNGLEILRTAVNEECSSVILLIAPCICFHDIHTIKCHILTKEHSLQFQAVTTKGYWVMKYSTQRAFFGGKEGKNWGEEGNHLKTNSLVP